MNLEHPMITEINDYGYPKEYLQYDYDGNQQKEEAEDEDK